MNDWRCYSSTDMKNWTAHGSVMNVRDFKWASKDAWASQIVARNGKFYFYAAV
jgi:arabinoxylan arabinofuranohydrolase